MGLMINLMMMGRSIISSDLIEFHFVAVVLKRHDDEYKILNTSRRSNHQTFRRNILIDDSQFLKLLYIN